MAALSVVFWHFMLGFYQGIVFNPAYGLLGTPFYGFVHGTAAVSVFLVLSGYVLTKKFFESGDPWLLIMGAIKRWPRLWLMVFISIMGSWALLHNGVTAYRVAGVFAGSPWLQLYGLSLKPAFDPSFTAAFKQSMFSVFFVRESFGFNPLLWTVRVELLGSYIAFALAGLIAVMNKKTSYIFLVSLFTAVALHFYDPFFVPFVPGVVMARFAPQIKNIKLPAALLFLAVGITCLGYRAPIGFYAFLSPLGDMNPDFVRLYISLIGACLIMASFIGCKPLKQSMQGPLAAYLGRISYPLFVVHLLVLFSLASWVFVRLHANHPYNVAALGAGLVLLVASLAVASLLAVADVYWIESVNSISTWLKRRITERLPPKYFQLKRRST